MTRKKTTRKPKQLDPDTVISSHARKLGIPAKDFFIDDDEMRGTWTGAGASCAETVTTIEKKLTLNGFDKLELDKFDLPPRDPVVEELEKLRLKPITQREIAYRKTSGEWVVSVLMEHNLGDTSDEDTAAVVIFFEEVEATS